MAQHKGAEHLGYDPNPQPITLGEELLDYRRRNGISRVKLAKDLGCDPETLRKWEKDINKPNETPHTTALARLGFIVT